MRFTQEEFDIMVKELLYTEKASFKMLCHIAEKTLKPSVINWCKEDDCLCGRGYADDIMQEICLRLIKTTVSSFLVRGNIEGPYNNDPEGFEDWMFRVAKNIKHDFAEKVRYIDFRTEDIDNPALAKIPAVVDKYNDKEYLEKLKNAFSIVISSDVSVYKILTWLAQFIFMLEYDVTKIKSNELIISAFENMSLSEMYDMILVASEKIPWISISSEQNKKIQSALRKIYQNDVTYGETQYKDFFMKHNGEVSGKKSISDWMNRMNNMIRRKTEINADPLKRNIADKKQRRRADETS